MLAIPCGGGGTFLGGWLIKRFNLDIRRILKFCGIVTIFAVCVGFVFLVHCTNVPFAGISIDYQQLGRSGESLGSLQLDATCNSGCGCSLLHYSPVCGRDNVMYYSPCYAGCLTAFPAHSEKYSNCSCVRYNFTAEDISKSQYWQAAEGKCENGCPHLPIFLPLFGFALISIFITSMPALSASLRCVTHDQRSFALGIQWIIARCLGSIPGPILFGKVIDLTCVMWQKNCQGDGTCFYYDNKRMSHNLLALATAFNSLSCVSFFLALLFYKTKPNSTTPKNTTALDDMTPSSLHTSMTTFTQPPTPNSEHSVDGFPVLTSFAYTAPPKPNKNSVDENLS